MELDSNPSHLAPEPAPVPTLLPAPHVLWRMHFWSWGLVRAAGTWRSPAWNSEVSSSQAQGKAGLWNQSDVGLNLCHLVTLTNLFDPLILNPLICKMKIIGYQLHRVIMRLKCSNACEMLNQCHLLLWLLKGRGAGSTWSDLHPPSSLIRCCVGRGEAGGQELGSPLEYSRVCRIFGKSLSLLEVRSGLGHYPNPVMSGSFCGR